MSHDDRLAAPLLAGLEHEYREGYGEFVAADIRAYDAGHPRASWRALGERRAR